MVQIVEQSHEEKVEMYMKLSKKELIAMLINCNDILSNQSIVIREPQMPEINNNGK